MRGKSSPEKKDVYSMLTEAALEGDNLKFLEAHRLLSVLLIIESDENPSEQARISSEMLKLTKELLSNRGDSYSLVEDSNIGKVGLGDLENG